MVSFSETQFTLLSLFSSKFWLLVILWIKNLNIEVWTLIKWLLQKLSVLDQHSFQMRIFYYLQSNEIQENNDSILCIFKKKRDIFHLSK